MSSDRRLAIEATLIAALVVLAYLLFRMSDLLAIGAFQDDAVYLALGKAIAAGEGYRSIYTVDAPVHVKYPPVLPLLYAALWSLGGSLETVGRLASFGALLATGAAAGVLWTLARRELALERGHAVLWAVAPFLFEGAIQCFSLAISEPYFALGWGGVLLLYYRMRGADHLRQRLTWAAGLGAACAAVTLTRTQAIVFFPAVIAALAIDRLGWRPAVAFAATGTLPLAIWRVVHARLLAAGPVATRFEEGSYGDWIGLAAPGELATSLASAVSLNWKAYWGWMPGYVSDARWAGVLVLVVFVLLAGVGAALLARRHAAWVLTILGTVAVIMVWPYSQDRFLFAFLPFVAPFAGYAAQRALAGARRPVRLAAYALGAALAATISARQFAIRRHAYDAANPYPVLGFPYLGHYLLMHTRYILTTSTWVLEHTTPADRLLVNAPAALYLYTGRRGVTSSLTESIVRTSEYDEPGRYLAARLLEDSVTVVVLGDLRHPITADVGALYQRCPGVLEFAGAYERWITILVYRVRRDAAGDACLVREFRGGG